MVCYKMQKNQYYQKKFVDNKGNGKKTLEVINQIVNKSRVKPKIDDLTINNFKVTDPQMLTNHFNKFFVNVGKDLASTLPQSDTNPLSTSHTTIESSCFRIPHQRK